MPVVSVGTPLGAGCSSCGYCGPPGGRSTAETSYKKSGLIASQLSCEVYQKMIDRGWRRSGTYCYTPDLRRSCCPQYTIKLDALQFKPSRSQRQLVNRWNRYVLSNSETDGTASSTFSKQTKKSSPTFDLSTSIHAAEYSPDKPPAAQLFRVTLEESSFSQEKYALYERYQTQIHHDYDNSPVSFRRFLVQSPLVPENIPYPSTPTEHLPLQYRSYHQMYRLDGELIAMGVLDVLPGCVSSVYFMYDPKWEKFSLGKLSALREASLAQEINNAGIPTMTSLYMGFYIHSCQKMRYKGEYSPSYLVDPEEFTWHPLSSCTSLLDRYRYATFAHPENSLEGPDDPGEEQQEAIPDGELEDVQIIYSIQRGVVSVIPITLSDRWKASYDRDEIMSCITALGLPLSKEIIFRL
ncbi:arginine-tRNA-protein transferase [Hygrophoropsis aurantiaca]|uniref:Arginine-tRNA-protein transferase n=1 Tax=Hygrophoropsis aurantiaca TaxID=72124 RepID=A0ACB8ATP7_9AGAM|nr:arginine-tRNA-protein transferase [Hygrophoropsis aurantiaca]